MRKKIVAANWKMNLTLAQGEKLVKELLETGITLDAHKEVVIAVPFPYLITVKELLKGHKGFYVAAQNVAAEKAGAFTGEVNAEMLHSIHTDYVLIGHSERRELFHESNATLAKKMDLALSHGLKPIFCCGEPLEIRKAETQNAFVAKQLEESLFHLTPDQLKHVVVAYEPIWAIGTGLTASAGQAQDMHAFIRQQVAGKYGEAPANELTILYGGSVKAANAAEIFAGADVDGGLVGGASLVAAEFAGIVKAI